MFLSQKSVMPRNVRDPARETGIFQNDTISNQVHSRADSAWVTQTKDSRPRGPPDFGLGVVLDLSQFRLNERQGDLPIVLVSLVPGAPLRQTPPRGVGDFLPTPPQTLSPNRPAGTQDPDKSPSSQVGQYQGPVNRFQGQFPGWGMSRENQ